MKLPAMNSGMQIPLHPFAFSVFPVISLYAANLGKGYLSEAIAIAAGLVVLVALLLLVVNLLTKQVSASAIILTAFLVLFFSFGHIISTVAGILDWLGLSEHTQFLAEGESSLIVWLTIGALLLVGVVRYVTNKAGRLGTLTQFLNIVALALLAISGLNLAYNSVRFYVMPRLRAEMDSTVRQPSGIDHEDAGMDELSSSSALANKETSGEAEGVHEFVSSWQRNAPSERLTVSSPMPDIYYIVVDAYARGDILQTIFGYDNSAFINYLVDKGFYVASASTANYPQTGLSLSSSLNMEYLDDTISQIGTYTSDRQPLAVMIKENKVSRLLRNSGYKLIAFDSGYDLTQIMEADRYLSPLMWIPSPFQEEFVMLTPLSVFRKTMTDFRRERILYAFEHIPDVTEIEEPTFVFAHVQIPHYPFIFDADGRPIEPQRGTGRREDYEYDEYIEAYSGQLAFVSKQLMATVNAILSRSPSPPIIIIQSDHGPSAHLDPSWSYSDMNLSERLSILNAYLFPDQKYESLYKEISPVNTFRVVFNEYFGADYELMDDRSYWATWDRPYYCIDVTGQLEREE